MKKNLLEYQIKEMSKMVKTDNYPMSIGEIANLYRDGDLKITPIYQRLFRWTIEQQTNLIESILLGIPIPSIYVYQDESGVWNLIDGLQRLSTLFKFMGILKSADHDNKIVKSEPLAKPRLLTALEGKLWDDEVQPENSLTEAQRRYIKRAKLPIIIIDKSSDNSAQYEMFRRLNTGGTQLSEQEIRNCMLVMQDENMYQSFCDLSKWKSFIGSAPLSKKDKDAQKYLELVVKFFVINHSEFKVSDSENFNSFLTDEIVRLINEKEINIEKDTILFKESFDLIYDVMRSNAFKSYNIEKKKHTGGVLVGSYEGIVAGLCSNLEYYKGNKEQLEKKINGFYNQPFFLETKKKGIRPIVRIKKLVKYSR